MENEFSTRVFKLNSLGGGWARISSLAQGVFIFN